MKIKYKSILLLISIVPLLLLATGPKGTIPDHNFIMSSLSQEAKLNIVEKAYQNVNTKDAMPLLLDYLKDNAKNRFYFNWEDFPSLLKDYDQTYPGIFDRHKRSADYQSSHYAPETSWDLPFFNLLGNEVSAYELRHLARQQKSLDMTLLYFQEDKKEYLDYWVRQVADLMEAYEKGEYEDAGNGVFEYYRAGRRIHSWIFNHHAYYSSPEYDKQDQEILLKTFIYHGFDLAKRTKKYHSGNHHTKGLVGLFEIAIFLQDFDFAKEWIDQSLDLLTEHMRREINPDGFQFERSVHYHFGDIENYFRVYQLAKINEIPVPKLFEERFTQMFSVLKQIAQPDGNLPVLQDDTDSFLRENNDLGGIFKAGALLLDDPELSYFASEYPNSNWYWLLSRMLSKPEIDKKRPKLESLALESTGYYIMRSGWDINDKYMSISAGVDEVKPDHQHGDMLGLTAYANGYQILPTYQVKYNKPDYYLFKNSWVKNVAIVDSIPHGLEYKGNKGGSGFGKFKDLPEPETILWKTRDHIDLYIGTHDRYENIGVETYRTVVFLKKIGQWIVVDHFISDEEHEYQQIWQGADRADDKATLHREFDEDLTMQIIQHSDAKYNVNMNEFRDKRSWMVSAKGDDFQFVTQIELKNDPKRSKQLKWNINKKIKSDDGQVIDISKNRTLVFGTTEIQIGKETLNSDKKIDLYLEKRAKGKYTIRNISPYTVMVNGQQYKPGQTIE